MPDWFEDLTGFAERSYQDTRKNLRIEAGRLVSKANGRSFSTGRLETPKVRTLRAQAAGREKAGTLRVRCIRADVRDLHADPANAGALFQVASQFNLLEMTGPGVTPEDGVSGYAGDPTQGPACAIAAGAATIYRNYFAPVDGKPGQTAERQIDCLADIGKRLGNENGSLWHMENGYTLCTAAGLAAIDQKLATLAPDDLDRLRDALRIGLHWDVEATAAEEPYPVVSQAFCSALPIAYGASPARAWERFARLVLEGAYEATLWAALVNAEKHPGAPVFLTMLGGGAFGNPKPWIHDALDRALRLVRGVALDVRIVCHGHVDPELQRLAKAHTGSSREELDL